MNEPWNLAVTLLTLGGLAAIAALASRASRSAIPVAMLFLLLGMVAGSEGLGGLRPVDHVLAYRVGTIALVLILFDGGFNTRFERVRPHLPPAVVLATLGVAATGTTMAGAGRLLGLSWPTAMLLGAVVSSTDAAAVFSVLRASGIDLVHRVGATIELESGLNDPMAVLLTAAMTEAARSGRLDVLGLAWRVPVELGIGAVVGAAVGWGCRVALVRLPPAIAGLVPVVSMAGAAVAYGAATVAQGSGFLAVYVTGLTLGQFRIPDRGGVRRVHDFLAWAAQVAVFLSLGLLVSPAQLMDIALPALAVAAVLVVVARPLAAALCLAPFRYPAREIVYVGWVGLRGAVPIVLATYPVMVGVDGGMTVFNMVFFVVVVGAVVQGGTVKWLTRRLGLEETGPPPPAAAVEVASLRPLDTRIICFYVDARAAVAGSTLADVPMPAAAAVMLIVRGSELVPARGATLLMPGDHVFVFCRPEDEATVSLWFGQRAGE